MHLQTVSVLSTKSLPVKKHGCPDATLLAPPPLTTGLCACSSDTATFLFRVPKPRLWWRDILLADGGRFSSSAGGEVERPVRSPGLRAAR